MEPTAALLRRNTALAVLVVGALAALSFLFFDRDAAWFAHGYKDAFVHGLAQHLSLLAHHTVVYSFAAVGFVAAALNLTGRAPRPWARRILFLCCCALAAIALVESVKFVFGRCRPELLFTEGRYGFTWFTTEYVRNSFPSGHTTRIFSLATGFALLWPRWALPAFCVAGVVGVSRVFALMHYPSDVLAGALVGILAGCWVFVLLASLQRSADSPSDLHGQQPGGL